MDRRSLRPHSTAKKWTCVRHRSESRLSTSFDVEGLQPMTAKSKYQNRIELLQGTLDMLILKTLQWGEQHGYGISQAIRVNSDEVLQVETGSLYPALHRLARQGWVQAWWKK